MLATIDLSGDDGKTLRERIRDAIVDAIESGSLSPGAPLPPSRELAASLGVSRDTVTRSYAELQSLNYVESRSTRGLFVSTALPRGQREEAPSDELVVSETRLSAYGRRFAEHSKVFPFSPDFKALNYGGPPNELVPYRRWRAHAQKFAQQSRKLSHQPQTLGLAQLRAALSGFLKRSKSIDCNATNTVVFSSTTTALNLLLRILVEPGEVIAVEDPGFGGVRNCAYGLGAELLGVPVDAEGMQVELLLPRKDVRVVYVTPAHHDPTGVALSLARRRKLLDWACEIDAWIIEDDFDGHFQYDQSALPSLKVLDENRRVIYISTLWKILYPLTNIGYCVLPNQLLPVIERARAQADGLSDVIAQLSLAAMIEEGYVERHLRRMRTIYRQRRTALIHNLKRAFGQDISIAGGASGTHILLRFSEHDRASVLAAAQEARLPMISTAPYYFSGVQENELVADFSCLQESTIAAAVARMAKGLSARS